MPKLHTLEIAQGSKPNSVSGDAGELHYKSILLIWTKIRYIQQMFSPDPREPNSDPAEPNSYLFPIDVTGCYCNHGGFSYKTSEKGSYSKSGSMNSVGSIERQ